MRKLGTVDLEILSLAMKEKGIFNEMHLEKSSLKRLGVGRILDALASLKDRKFISLNSDGSFSITELAKNILWSADIPIWARILRLLQIKSCSIDQVVEILSVSEEKIIEDIEHLRKNQLILMSPQRQEEKLIKIYEILPEGIERIDRTETEGFTGNPKLAGVKLEVETLDLVEKIIKDIQDCTMEQSEKEQHNRKGKQVKR